MDVPSIVASTSDGGVPWFVSLAAEPLLLIQELHPGLNISALPPPPVPISLRSGASLQRRACSDGSSSNSNDNNNNNNNNNGNNNNNNNSNSNKSGGTNLVGPVVGAVVGTLVLAILAFLIYRAVQRRKARAATVAAANATGIPPANVTPFPNPNLNFTPPPMKETGSYIGPGGVPVVPNAYQVNMNVANSTGAPSTYSSSDRMSYYNAGGQNPGNAYFNQMPNPMPPPMPTAMPQNPQYNGPAPSPWNVNMAVAGVHPGQSPSPGIISSGTPAPTFESSGISSTSSPPPMSPSVAGSNYAPWANPGAQGGSSSNTSVPMAAFMSAQQEKAQFSGAYPPEKSQFSGMHAPVAASTYAGGSSSGKPQDDAPKPAPASSPPQQHNNATNEEDALPVGLPPPAYTFAAQ